MASTQTFTAPLAYLRGLGKPAAQASGAYACLDVLENGVPVATRDLHEGVYRLGARADCDLVLPDAGVAHMATLNLEKQPRGKWSVSVVPFVEGLSVNGLMATAFTPVILTSAATLVSGKTTLRISPPQDSAERTGLSGLPGMGRLKGIGETAAKSSGINRLEGLTGGAVAKTAASLSPRPFLFVAGLLFLAALASGLWDVVRPHSVDDGNLPIGSTLARIDDQAELIRTLRQQLQTADLADHVKVRAEGKLVVIEGAVTERQEERYRSLLNAVRKRTSIDVRSMVQPSAHLGQIEIHGVALEPATYIVLNDGQRYRVGDILPQGWQVDSISAKSVILSRDGLRETIPLNAR